MVRRARAVCPARACARALSGTVSQAFPRIEQGQLTLLGIEVQQRAHHLLHDLQLIRRVAGVSCPLGSVTKRVLCIPVQSTYECKIRGEEQWHYPPRGEADAQTRKPCHVKMSSRSPSKPCLRATFLLRFLRP